MPKGMTGSFLCWEPTCQASEKNIKHLQNCYNWKKKKSTHKDTVGKVKGSSKKMLRRAYILSNGKIKLMDIHSDSSD